ncbi:MAG: hypothetical protein AAGG53_13170 [Cyanobacteria bacterium P01_H01_bin.152]
MTIKGDRQMATAKFDDGVGRRSRWGLVSLTGGNFVFPQTPSVQDDLPSWTSQKAGLAGPLGAIALVQYGVGVERRSPVI